MVGRVRRNRAAHTAKLTVATPVTKTPAWLTGMSRQPKRSTTALPLDLSGIALVGPKGRRATPLPSSSSWLATSVSRCSRHRRSSAVPVM